MMTVNQAMDTFLRSLELDEREEEQVRRQREYLRERVRDKLPIQRGVIIGSFDRRTAIRPPKDVDLLFVLDDRDDGARRLRGDPSRCLSEVESALRRAYPNDPPKITRQRRSVNIWFAGTGVGYDVVPGFSIDRDQYEIPDRLANGWIRTNPERHKQACVEANERAGGMLNRMIKAAKRWNRLERAGGKALSSFHLEALSYSVFGAKPSSFAEGLARLFRMLSERVRFPCPDPARIGPDIDAGWDARERERARALLVRAAQSAEAAVQSQTFNLPRAHQLWRELLGGDYPEQGW